MRSKSSPAVQSSPVNTDSHLMQLASFHATRYLINQVRTDAPKTLTAGGGGGGGGGVPGFNSAQVRTDAPKTLTAGGGGVPGFNS